MKALSLTRPWCWIIEHLGKRIENRTWNTDYRGPVLLHSSKTMTRKYWYEAHDFVTERFGWCNAQRIPKPSDPKLVKSAIVLVAELVDVIEPGWKFPRSFQLADDTADMVRTPWILEQKRWYMGEFAFVLRYVTPTNVVPCNGTHKLWTPSRELVSAALDGIKWPGTAIAEPWS